MPEPTLVVLLSNDVSISFHRIPHGAFRMGSRGVAPDEEPCHVVRITRPFYLGTTPVTQEQFGVWTRERTPPGGVHENHFKDRPDHPAENVSWDDARAFCAWLNEAHRAALPDSYVATLPTEAEWEYACRAKKDSSREGGWILTETEYFTGDGEDALREAGWFGEDWEKGSTHPVGEKTANGFGLHDLHGNVWEWCWDAYDADAYKTRVDGVVDPGHEGHEGRAAFLGGPQHISASEEADPDRVLRGGSWLDSAGRCRSAVRDRGWPGHRIRFRGFRVCLVPGPRTSAPGDGARRDAEAESEGAGTRRVADLSTVRFSSRARTEGQP